MEVEVYDNYQLGVVLCCSSLYAVQNRVLVTEPCMVPAARYSLNNAPYR